MNITMFCDQFHPELGGIPDAVDAITRALSARGHSVTLHVPQYSPVMHVGLHHNRRPATPEHHVPLCRRPAINYSSKVAQARLSPPSPTKWLGLIGKKRPDIIHVHTFLGLGLEGLLVARLLQIPIIATNHTAVKAFGAYFPVSTSVVSNFVLWFCNRCDVVTAPSSAAFDELDTAKVRKPFYILPNPVDLDVFHTVTPGCKQLLKTKLGLPSRTICYAGRLAPEKAIQKVFQAIKFLRDWDSKVLLVIAGAGSEYEALVAMATALGINSNVRFVGVLDHQHLAMLFQACDAFVTMCTGEVLSLTLLQAMACGLPVICARSPASSNIVRSGVNGYLVEPEANYGLANRISGVLSDTSGSTLIGQVAAKSTKQFALHTITQDWEDLYHSIIDSKRLPW